MDLHCPLCVHLYSSTGESCPCILQCGHTACAACFNRLITEDTTITCPFDKRNFDVVLPFAKNFALIDLIGVVNPQMMEPPEPPEPLEPLEPPTKVATPQRCSVHDDVVHLFDITCKQFVCRDCLSLEHYGHQCVQIKEAANTARQYLHDMDAIIKTQTDILVLNTERIISLEEEKRNCEETIQSTFSDIHQRLLKRKDDLLTELGIIYKTKTFELDAQASHIRANAAFVQRERGSDIEVIENIEVIEAQIQIERHVPNMAVCTITDDILFVSIPKEENFHVGTIISQLATIQTVAAALSLLQELKTPRQIRIMCNRLFDLCIVGKNITKNICDTLLPLMITHFTDEELQSAACRVLTKLDWIAIDVVDAILKAMRSYPKNILLQSRACKALESALGIPERKVMIVEVIDALHEMVLLSMECNPQDELTQKHCCIALDVLIHNTFTRKLECASADVMRSINGIILALHTFPKSVDVLSCGLRALGWMAVDDANENAIVEQDGHKHILAIMRSNPTKFIIQELGCSALLNLSVCGNNKELAKEAGAVDVVFNAIRTFPLKDTLLEKGFMLLARLDVNVSTFENFIRAAKEIFPQNKVLQHDHIGKCAGCRRCYEPKSDIALKEKCL